MNANRPPEDAQLSALLRTWRVASEPSPGFSQTVWRKIEQRQSALPASQWTLLLEYLRTWLSQPRAAVICSLTLVVLGSAAGWFRGQASSRDVAEGLQVRYVASIDPFAHRVR